MNNLVKFLDNDIIYVEKAGDQTPQSMLDLFGEISKLASQLRRQEKRVLILSNAEKETKMDAKTQEIAAAIGKDLDYDKSATYGVTHYMEAMRANLIHEAQLDTKVANFKTKHEAADWLLGN